ncbi:MAG: UPF0175 family protein [Fibrobacter sp.]|uniref:UPF0175 family protein n=1 Tax=Fibrobacter sp. TaxID=35828 RepID=UPI001B21363D|nr:UPF0175 family protein [Fibrobacter sp.]MBO7061351.1 UPF0175 family protein [Fibrobacter sp.]
MATVTMNIPEEIMDFMVCENKSDELRRNALLLYPFIKNETISHGRAADILGISKWELIELLRKRGNPLYRSELGRGGTRCCQRF